MYTAVIDSGIYVNGELEGKVTNRIEFLGGNERKRNGEWQEFIHGTTCAEIISGICPQVKFIDLRAMCRDGTTQINKLLEALDWCLFNKIKLIHLSLGTINYFDIKLLENKIRKLRYQDTMIVAAYHNLDIRTYPAALPGVFGVRQDRKGILEENQFLFQAQEGYNYENTIVAHWRGEAGNKPANSYAAPVITGYVAKLLAVNKNVDFHTALESLKRIGKSDKQYPDEIQNVIQSSNVELKIPVIAGEGLCHKELQILADWFENEGYQVLLLQEQLTAPNAIPMDYYAGKGVSLEHILHTVDKVYEPDIIFLDFNLRKIAGESEETVSIGEVEEPKDTLIDMYISYSYDMHTYVETCDIYPIRHFAGPDNKLKYKATAIGLRERVRGLNGICGIICRYFE